MVILTSIRKSPSYLYAKTYCICALVTLIQATPISSRIQLTKTVTRFRNGRILTTRPSPHDVEHARDLQAEKTAPVTEPLSERATKSAQRWYSRASDLASVKTLLERDKNDVATYPELKWDAKVRYGSGLHPEEQKSIELRKHRMSSDGRNSLHQFLDLPSEEKVDLRDVPLIALGGSGGGYRVMYGFAGFISAAKKLGLWDCITWTAGVSGSCWTLAAYYTIARHDITKLIDHYLTVASELSHPMSIHALDMVARSKRGVYFLIGPLVSKAQKSIIGLSMMDLYSTLTATYQLLSREPKGRLSRATFQWSKIWHRSGIDKGLEPMPILASVRRVPRYSFEPKTVAAKAQTIKEISELQDPSSTGGTKPSSSIKNRPRKFFQYFEISPLEIGSPDLHRFLQMKQLEGLWGNPIRAGHDPNPFYGLEEPLRSQEHAPEHAANRPHVSGSSHSSSADMSNNETQSPNTPPWEAQGRIRLMDCGMANNLPNHILARPERGVDVFVSFDASSDIHTGAAVQRLHHFAGDFNIELIEETKDFHKPQKNKFLTSAGSLEVESRYLDYYARVFRGTRHTGQTIYVIYCPLLPNGLNPDFDPSTASFSTSTNLVWTPDQILLDEW
ncbi:Ff.00g000490.m01.CDS01 [Fusarium sp. VM40]|nr:Ff.00g000490.m01.CDS01 [Fusarium sp. VM40]